MIAIVDYGMGNLGSIKRKLDIIGVKSVITDSPKILNTSEKIILPGVGHFSMGVNQLKDRGLWSALNYEVIDCKKPILGICLGMQLMTQYSEEGNVAGLGWFEGNAIRFKVSDKIKYKVPHIGWNTIDICKKHEVFEGVYANDELYFVHSYHVVLKNETEILSKTIYDYSFASAIVKNNIFGFQFHPEKSHDVGRKMLKNFIDL